MLIYPLYPLFLSFSDFSSCKHHLICSVQYSKGSSGWSNYEKILIFTVRISIWLLYFFTCHFFTPISLTVKLFCPTSSQLLVFYSKPTKGK